MTEVTMEKTALTLPILVLAAAACATAGELTVGGADGLSPQEALLKIRAAKAAGDTDAWKVRVRPGVYSLTETLTFTPADSGTPEAPVSWIGEGDGAVFSGGQTLGPWKEREDGVWEAPAPRGADGRPVWFEQLWIDGRRASRARFPETGFFKIAKSEERQQGEGAWEQRLFLTNAAVKAALSGLSAEDLGCAQVLAVHKWSFTRRVIRDYDSATGGVVTRSPLAWDRSSRMDGKETLVWFENLPTGFDSPGEWFYDAPRGRILYRPLPGERPETLAAVAPVRQLCRLLAFDGRPEDGRYVENLRFENLTFAHTAGTPHDGRRQGPSESFQLQAACWSDGAVTARGARRLVFDGCTFRQTGNYGLRFNDGTFSNRVENCRFEDVGAGGAWMGAEACHVAKGETLSRREIVTLTPLSCAFNVIDNCLFRHGGYFNPEGTAVAFTHISDSKVLHCAISDFYYTGISVGLVWGYGGSVAQRNEIAFNRVGSLGKGVMSDMAGIYLLGTSFGTTVHDNVVHDIDSYSYGGRGLYVDEGGEGIVFERNLVWNTTNAGLHQHYGVGCVYRNNIAAFSRQRGVVQTSRRYADDVPSSLHVVGNIILSDGDRLVGEGACDVPGVWAGNLWFDTTGRADFGGKTWTEWQACDKERGGVYADPRFVDAAHHDFRLRDDSPALKMGFRPWDMSQAGLRRQSSQKRDGLFSERTE